MLKGLKGLIDSKKATLCLLILICSTAALFTKHLDGTSYAAIMTVISTIYCWTAHKTDIANLGIQP